MRKLYALVLCFAQSCLVFSQTASIHDDLTTCGSELGCLRSPDECGSRSDDCEGVMTWMYNSKEMEVDFALSLNTKSNSQNHYIAMGFANEPKMADSSIISCLVENGVVDIQNSYNNKNRENIPLKDDDSLIGVTVIKKSYTDGVLRCTFKRNVTVDHDQAFNLDQSYFLLYARGPTSNKRLLQHDQRLFTSSKVDLMNATSAAAKSGDLTRLRIHACLMVGAWVLCAGLAIILARYYRDMWPSSEIYGKPIWFMLHMFLQMFNLLLNTAAVILMFQHVEGMSEYKTGTPKIARVHPIIGIVVFCLAFMQYTVAACCRPHPDQPNRYLFNWAHWFVGTVVHYGAILNIFLGLGRNESSSFTKDWLKWVLLGYIIVHVLWQFVLEMVKSCGKDKIYRKEDGTNVPRYSGIRTFLLLTYVLLAWGSGLVIIISLASK